MNCSTPNEDVALNLPPVLPAKESTASEQSEQPKVTERVFKNTIAIIIARGFSDLFHVLVAVKMARYLAEKAWGLFCYFLSSIEVFRVLTNFGVDVITIRLMAISPKDSKKIENHLLVLKTLLTILVILIIFGLSFILKPYGEHRGVMLLLGLGLFCDGYLNSLTVRFKSFHQMDKLIFVQFLSGAFYLAAVYFASYMGTTVAGFVICFVAFEFIRMLITAFVSRGTWSKINIIQNHSPISNVEWPLFWKILGQGIPVGLLELIVVIYSRLGIFLLEKFGSLESVGQFFISMKICEPVVAIGGALSTSAFPVLARLVEQKNVHELRQRFIRYSVRSALLSCSLAGLLTFFSSTILQLIKPQYLPGAHALVAVSWASVCMFQNLLSTIQINAFGKYYLVTISACINLCVYLTSSMILIPAYHATGAGLSTLITEGINAIIQLVMVFTLFKHLEPAYKVQPSL